MKKEIPSVGTALHPESRSSLGLYNRMCKTSQKHKFILTAARERSKKNVMCQMYSPSSKVIARENYFESMSE